MSDILLHDRVYTAVQEKIFRHELVAGQRISQHTLARELGVSRMPVRDALRRLETEGLVRSVPRSGTVVAPVTRQYLIELFELREAIEPFAAELAARRITQRELSKLQRVLDKMRDMARAVLRQQTDVPDDLFRRRWLDTDRHFHQLVVAASGNSRLMRLTDDAQLLASTFTLPTWVIEKPIHAVNAYRAHARVLRALRRRNKEHARQSMATHIQKALKTRLTQFDEEQARQKNLLKTV